MNINALNEDNLWFIKNVPVAGAKLINSLGEGCVCVFFSSISFFFFQFYVSPLESQLFKSTSSYQNLLTRMKTRLNIFSSLSLVLGFVSRAC